ncbi:hypothetical protein [Mycobacterium sp. IS-3022]|uniref:hypothetical protein n=1 Tax=Mycobacterium sp. IS-3022 TaxID=1772277 RepID=UPI00074177B3|nr:hypothetical protein [Mycobacterium sp. IS-3022]KUH99269.1 hypothetical protein AU188_11455 [Mycobacterium sp. IS-3022]
MKRAILAAATVTAALTALDKLDKLISARVTYADIWRDVINAVYPFAREDFSEFDVGAICLKAAECLRDGKTHTFDGDELDIIRHVMPAHEVGQSGAKRWVLDEFGLTSSPLGMAEDEIDELLGGER